MSYPWEYHCVQESFYDLEMGEYTSYGICLYHKEEIEPVLHIKDISLNGPLVRWLTKVLNEYEAEAVHFVDIVEDHLP